MRAASAAILLALLLGLSGAVSASAEVLQYFSSEGALLPQARPPLRQAASLPEGIKPRADTSYQFYPVFGKTFAELLRSVEENAPIPAGSGGRAASRLDWKVGISYSIEYDYESDEETGSITASIQLVSVSLRNEYVIVLPAAVNDSSLNPVERTLFRTYVAKLIETEYAKIRKIEDPALFKSLRDHFSELEEIQLAKGSEANIEQLIERSVRQETAKIAKDYVRAVKESLNK